MSGGAAAAVMMNMVPGAARAADLVTDYSSLGQPVRDRTGLFQDTSAAAQIPLFGAGEENRAQFYNHGHTVLWHLASSMVISGSP